MRPLIGITCSVRAGEGGRPSAYRLNQAYVRAVAHAGGTPLLIPCLEDPDALRRLFDSVDAILLPGGADIEPSLYGAAPHPKLGEVDPLLDSAELTLARWALAEEKPVLGICRGQQCLNVAAGGTLYQDIASDVAGALDHHVEPRDAHAHELAVEPESRLADLLGTAHTSVNSLHHQSVWDVAPGFIAVAWAPDGVIEGLERSDHPFALAVQFHPEELVPGHEPSERLLIRFVAEAGTRSGFKVPGSRFNVGP